MGKILTGEKKKVGDGGEVKGDKLYGSAKQI